jgi:hypothetical protein
MSLTQPEVIFITIYVCLCNTLPNQHLSDGRTDPRVGACSLAWFVACSG